MNDMADTQRAGDDSRVSCVSRVGSRARRHNQDRAATAGFLAVTPGAGLPAAAKTSR
jgi:hypothetical protein